MGVNNLIVINHRMKKHFVKLTEDYAKLQPVSAYRLRLKNALQRCRHEVHYIIVRQINTANV